MKFIYALALVVFLVVYSLRKKSLSPSGAAAAAALGMATFTADLTMFTVVLLVFYVSSSRLTKFKAEYKKKIDAEYVEGGQRDLVQVFCNAFTGAVYAITYQYFYRKQTIMTWSTEDRLGEALIWAYVGFYACCNGDTWASEIGVLNSQWPFLITTLQKVPPGTNGGISILGLGASLAGGLLVGVAASFTLYLEGVSKTSPAMVLVVVGAVAGLMGSLIDSLLGATVQETLFSEQTNQIVGSHGSISRTKDVRVISGINLLSNNQVNFISSLVTSVLCGLAATLLY